MSKNTLNSGSLQGLKAGQTLLHRARKVNGGKIELEYAEVLEKEPKPVSLVALFNASDSRFSQGGTKAQRAWAYVSPVDAGRLLGIDLSDNADWYTDQQGRQLLDLNILNPVVMLGSESHSLKVQIIETVVPTDYQEDNIESTAKRKGADGDFCTHKGMYIFSNSTVVLNTANHIFLEMDKTTKSAKSSNGIYANVDAATGEIFN
jgi:hypothetical protein